MNHLRKKSPFLHKGISAHNTGKKVLYKIPVAYVHSGFGKKKKECNILQQLKATTCKVVCLKKKSLTPVSRFTTSSILIIV